MKKYIAPKIEIEDIFSEDIITLSPFGILKAPGNPSNITVVSDGENGVDINGNVNDLLN